MKAAPTSWRNFFFLENCTAAADAADATVHNAVIFGIQGLVKLIGIFGFLLLKKRTHPSGIQMSHLAPRVTTVRDF